MAYIINQQPNLDIQPLNHQQLLEIASEEDLTLKQLRQVLDTIAYSVRMKMEQYHNLDIKINSLKGLCIEATERICYDFGNLFDIVPLETQAIFHKWIYHSFAVGYFQTILGVKRYIIDLTYRQFCLEEQWEFERGNMLLPGQFFTNTTLLRKLLKDGYLEVTKESLINYGSSFVIAGAYFEQSKHNTFTQPSLYYTYEEYSEAIETGKMLVKKH